jgi:hypothetical protein
LLQVFGNGTALLNKQNSFLLALLIKFLVRSKDAEESLRKAAFSLEVLDNVDLVEEN